MKYLTRLFHIYWPIFLLVFLEGFLFSANFTPNTYLIGWDNMFPEFDFASNIKRTFFAIWQEYRGLGYQDGMSHAANLIHYLILWIMSLVVPQQLLRYVFVFGTHLIGGIGMYLLIFNIQSASWRTIFKQEKMRRMIALFGALVYQYCFATVQMFYLPFELFLVHFASLPWVFVALNRFLASGKRSDAMLFGLIMLLSTPQTHVPTVFLVTVLAMGIFLLWELITSRGTLLKRIGVIVIIIFCVNAFWGIPFTYSTLTRSQVITGSKNNQIATEDIFEKNHAFGGFLDTAEMKSFALTYIHYDYKKLANEYMMKPWINHIDAPLVQGSLLSLFSLAVVGFIFVLLRRDKSVVPYALLFLFAFLVIGNDIPILSSFSLLVRTYIPYASDIFRFVFTKFFFLYAFSFAILTSYALSVLIQWIMKKRPIISMLPIFAGTLMLLVTTIPSFQENFLYKNLRVEIPKEYFQVFSFFKEQPSDQRILVLPMPWYWAWTQYRWGVIGSGFTWFGIRQPLIDRAFDPWSNFNEGVYWEFSQAIYEQNQEQFMELLAKYDIRWIMVDENIMHPTNDKALYLSQIENMLRGGAAVQEEKQFGKIMIFSLPKQSDSFIQIRADLPNIGPQFQWNDRDQAYNDNGSYLTSDAFLFTSYYPFRSLFTGHEQNEKEFTVSTSDQAITFLQTLPPSVEKKENYSVVSDDGQLDISFQNGPPYTISATIPITDPITVYDSGKTADLMQPIKSCDASRNGLVSESWQDQNSGYRRVESTEASACLDIGLSNLSQRYGYVVLVKSRHISGRRLFISITNEETKRTFLESYVTNKGVDNEFADSFFIIPPMDPYGKGYRITLDNLSVNNEKTVNDIGRIRVYKIPYEEMVKTRIQNTEDGKQNENATKIQVESVEHPNPVYYKISLQPSAISNQTNTTLILSQSYDEGWRAYTIQNSESLPRRQAGRIRNWLQTTFPFLFGKEIKEHVMVNNWENAWQISKTSNSGSSGNSGNAGSIAAHVAGPAALAGPAGLAPLPDLPSNQVTIVLFFLPQLLEYLGFALLPIPFLILLLKK